MCWGYVCTRLPHRNRSLRLWKNFMTFIFHTLEVVKLLSLIFNKPLWEMLMTNFNIQLLFQCAPFGKITNECSDIWRDNGAVSNCFVISINMSVNWCLQILLTYFVSHKNSIFILLVCCDIVKLEKHQNTHYDITYALLAAHSVGAQFHFNENWEFNSTT